MINPINSINLFIDSKFNIDRYRHTRYAFIVRQNTLHTMQIEPFQ